MLLYTVYNMNRAYDIDKPNLSESSAATVRERIVLGHLPAGARINEVHLGSQLGVSRTPLREALMRLAAEGTVVSKPRFGFYVAALTLDEFEQVYVIRQLLDPAALRLAGIPTDRQLARLVALNDKLGETTDPARIIERDNAWHLELVSHCPNRTLITLIEQFIDRGRRYELALMRERSDVERSMRDHDDILDALKRGDLEVACRKLHLNMESGKEPIINWLRELRSTHA